MSNIKDYIYWMGNESFGDRPFSEADALVMSELVYLDLKTVEDLAADQPLSVLCQKLEEKGKLTSRTTDGAGRYDYYKEFYQTAAKSRRFGTLMVRDIEDSYDEQEIGQFAAARFVTPEGISFIAFRGTDETITGWKEDFAAGYTVTYGHRRSVLYLENVLGKLSGNETIYVGGHSKGGNLSRYSTASVSDEALAKIDWIYSLDGPGLAEDVFDLSILERIRNKYTEIVPEFCVLGRLFTKKILNMKIVKSDAEGLRQHGLLSWQIGPDGLRFTDILDPASIAFMNTVDDWIFSGTKEERQTFVDAFFDSMRGYGASKFTEMGHGGTTELESILVSMASKGPEPVKMAAAFERRALFGSDKPLQERLADLLKLKKKALVMPLLMILSGIIFLLIPDSGIRIFALIALLIPVIEEAALTLSYLKKNGWNLQEQKPRVVILFVMIVLFFAIVTKESALTLLAGAILAVLFFVIAYFAASDFRHWKRTRKRISFLFLVEAGIFAALGVLILVLPEQRLEWSARFIGTAMLIEGIYRAFLFSLTDLPEGERKTEKSE
ncbi:MAG: Mbeg1-like protein [Eubacterium sp.]|nr:Mbeg1-like protein [Eubacterium sp.]